MWKTLCLLSLTLFTFDFHRLSLVRGEPVTEDDVFVAREEDPETHRAEIRSGAEARDKVTDRGIHDDEATSSLVGKWRNNGEALEPKWRDGDTVPVLPFPRFSRYSGDKVDEQDEGHVRRRPKYRRNNEHENSLRPRNNGPSFYDYEDYDLGRGYRDRELLPRKKTGRPWTNHDPNRNGQVPTKSIENGETTSARYRETTSRYRESSARYRDTLQARPNEYELELRISEEEYLKPRPRKRKPPQNHEFALARNETLNEQTENSSGSQTRTSSSGKITQNAVELKSLLKMQQEEGLSLSEILQRRNLTLNDLLKGRADAIDALKTKNVDETEDYIEQATKMISDSLVKIPIATNTGWPFEEPARTTGSRKDELVVVYSTNPPLREYSLGTVNRDEMYATRKSMPTERSSPSRVTTSVPLPVVTNSMQLLHGSVKSRDADEIKADSLDDDEIMEFSDFTDFKKGRNGVTPVWLMVNDEVASRKTKDTYEDRGSSVEKIKIDEVGSQKSKNYENRGSTLSIHNTKNDEVGPQKTKDNYEDRWSMLSIEKMKNDEVGSQKTKDNYDDRWSLLSIEKMKKNDEIEFQKWKNNYEDRGSILSIEKMKNVEVGSQKTKDHYEHRGSALNIQNTTKNDEVESRKTKDNYENRGSMQNIEKMKKNDEVESQKTKDNYEDQEYALSIEKMKNDEVGSQKSNDNYEDRGSTLSIEKILSPTERSKLNNSSDGEQINLDDTGDYDVSSEREYQNDAPPMYVNLEHTTRTNSFVDESKIQEMEPVSIDLTLEKDSRTEEIEHGVKNHQDPNTTEGKSYDDVISEVEPEARAEIFELFASGSAGKRLERLLKSRNMSLEELIALRQRGSSKVHLADVSRIKVHKLNDEYGTEDTAFKTTTIPKTDEESAIPKIDEISTIIPKTDHESTTNGNIDYLSFQNATNCNSVSSAVDVRSEGTEESKISENSPFDARSKDDEAIQERHRKAQIIDLLTTFGSMPFAKDIRRDFTGYKDETKVPTKNNDQVFANNDTNVVRLDDNSTVIQSGRVKEIVEQKPNSIRTAFNEVDTEKTIDEKRRTLSNVKRSIIASGAILGVTIVVFLAIFIVCRIRQKQKYRYRNKFSRAVFQGPVMAARKLSNSSSLSTVMVNVIATSTTKRPEKNETEEPVSEMESKSDIDNDSLDANDSWETIPDYMK